MKFSIIIPVYNVENYICQCVDSVLAQTFHDYEIILVDDGSPDRSPVICDEYAVKDIRIKVIHKSNGGLSDARNVGLDVARGEYVIFLDSDDWWDDPDALMKIDKSIQLANPDIIIVDMKKYFMLDERIDEVYTPKKCKDVINILSYEQIMQEYMQNNIFVACAWDKVIRRNFIEDDHLRFVRGQYSEDIEWCCRLLMKRANINILDDAFYVYRQQVSTSITANVSIKNINCIIDIISRYAHRESALPLLHFLANQYVLLITNFMRLPQNEQKAIGDKIQSFWWLLDYDWYPYVRLVSRMKFLGFTVIKKLLRLYYLYKRM